MSQDVTQDILTQAVEEVIVMFGKVVLAELERKLPLSRQQLRRLQKNDFKLWFFRHLKTGLQRTEDLAVP